MRVGMPIVKDLKGVTVRTLGGQGLGRRITMGVTTFSK